MASETAETLLLHMHPSCRLAWDEYESQYAGGMGGGRMTAIRAFKFAWDQALYTVVGSTVDRLNAIYAKTHGWESAEPKAKSKRG